MPSSEMTKAPSSRENSFSITVTMDSDKNITANFSQLPPPPSGSGNITIRARMTNGTSDQFELRLDDQTVHTWTVTGSSYADYSHSGLTGSANVKIYFQDNGTDARLDYIEVNGTLYQAEDQQVNTSAWNNTCGGDSFTDRLHCPGYIDFGTINFGSGTTPTYSLTVNASNGSVSRSPDKAQYDDGEQVTLTANADSGYDFDNWSGDASGSNTSITVTMNSDKNITANFSAVQTGGGTDYRYIRVRVTATNTTDGRLRLNDFLVGDASNWYSVSAGLWDNFSVLPTSQTLDMGAGNSLSVTRYDVHTVWSTTRTPRDFVIEGSNDNSTWTEIESVSGRNSSAYSSNGRQQR